MSSRTKRPIIDGNSKKEADELETTVDLYNQLSQYERMIKDENERRKAKIAREIESMGSTFLKEIDDKVAQKEEERILMVENILKSYGEKHGKAKELYNLSHEELNSIYTKIKESEKPWYKKLFELFMG